MRMKTAIMNFELKGLDLAGAAREKVDALLLLVPDGFQGGDDGLSRQLERARAAKDLDPKSAKLLACYGLEGVTARRVTLALVGAMRPREVRAAVTGAMSAWKSGPVRKVGIVFAAQPDAAALRAAVLAAADAAYVYRTTKPSAEPRHITGVRVGVPDREAVSVAFARASATVAGVELAREWANRPANHATPSQLAQAAQDLARAPRMRCEVLGPRQVARLGMGAFSAVAQGSREELRFIVLRYDGAARQEAPVVLVGKGITFDTGGISIKPAPEMDEMKFDMGGAASVLGVFRALADLKPAVNVVGLIPACENMPDGGAVKPGDVVTSLSGQTIEILNTDAEGRLILCDALSYAERFEPRAVIDIATLTGACVIALGAVRSGLFSPDDALAHALSAAGEAAQDPCWRLPLDDDYAEGLKSHFADVANVGGRAGGAITAAKFLQRFASRFPWAHLDIAGTAWKGGAAKGATGRPVGLLLEYLLSAGPASDAPAPAARRARGSARTKA